MNLNKSKETINKGYEKLIAVTAAMLLTACSSGQSEAVWQAKERSEAVPIEVLCAGGGVLVLIGLITVLRSKGNGVGMGYMGEPAGSGTKKANPELQSKNGLSAKTDYTLGTGSNAVDGQLGLGNSDSGHRGYLGEGSGSGNNGTGLTIRK